ncbi:MAG: 8-oxo-dGTP diphosphatase [Clostridia bacterium]|nr:8-oxo-dGTP diphosphatase [Clostridia bacterium]
MNCELTNMVMIENPENGMVLVQNRVKYWTGVTFPGGHVEKGESFTDSAVREAKEETGLDIKNPKLCGTVHWCHKDTDERYIVLLYKTNEYSGELVDKTDEGEVFWINKEDLKNYQLSPNFSTYLKVFLSDDNEAFGLYNKDGDDEMIIL